jgi:hypothetical protein
LIGIGESRDFEQCMLRVVKALHTVNSLFGQHPRFPTAGTINSLSEACVMFGRTT